MQLHIKYTRVSVSVCLDDTLHFHSTWNSLANICKNVCARKESKRGIVACKILKILSSCSAILSASIIFIMFALRVNTLQSETCCTIYCIMHMCDSLSLSFSAVALQLHFSASVLQILFLHFENIFHFITRKKYADIVKLCEWWQPTPRCITSQAKNGCHNSMGNSLIIFYVINVSPQHFTYEIISFIFNFFLRFHHRFAA